MRTDELLGEALLKAGRASEAVAAYERALRLTPKRSAALLGLARAKSAAGDRAGAADAYRQLAANWHAADPAVAALNEARTGAAIR
jgi:cytochrome c-type biogenesis protein CcmH/NrfG